MLYICDCIYNNLEITLMAKDNKLIGLWFKDQKYHGKTIYKNYIVNNNLDVFIKTKECLIDYFNGKKPDFKSIEIEINKTKFQQEIFQILLEIPYGKTATYKDVALEYTKRTNKKIAYQAVGKAIGQNPISIIVPCHRIIGSNNKLTGYAAGLEIKEKLLKLEGIAM